MSVRIMKLVDARVRDPGPNAQTGKQTGDSLGRASQERDTGRAGDGPGFVVFRSEKTPRRDPGDR